jgi:23S rRNA (uracil1939-C5)-methyltransferase
MEDGRENLRRPEVGRVVKDPSLQEVDVRGIGSGGVGIGTLPDGRVIFLPRTAPGDRVLARPVTEKSRWARGEAVEILQEGPGRRTPPCPRYSACDGCSLQHLAYEEQLRWKGRMAGDALRRIGGMEVEDPAVEASPGELRYRNRMAFTLRRLPGDRVVAGLRELGRVGRILDVGGECLLPSDELSGVWEDLRRGWGPGARLLPEGRELRLTLRQGDDGAVLLVKGGRGEGRPDALLEAVPGLRSVWRALEGGSHRHLVGDPFLRTRWLGEELDLPGGGFLQVNTGGGEALHRYVLQEAGPVKDREVVDAYCGVGSLGRALARAGARVTGIEADPEAVAVAATGAPAGFRAVVGRVEDLLNAYLPAFLVILNPPRGGLGIDVPVVLNTRVADRVIYISCDPATLARDLARLGEAYSISRVHCFDLFPQTGHVETVVTLDRKEG